MSAEAYRLPTRIRPKAYAIDIATWPARPDFEGTVTIELDVLEPSDDVEMHARDLEIAEARISAGGREQNAKVDLDPRRETVRFTPAQPMPAGPAKLYVRYTGKPSPGMHGLYLASDGKARAICTQCEATDARAIFPCFDEPEFKASLAWTIRAPGGQIALSNGPLEREEDAKGLHVWRFAPTRPVSSYLAALVVGDFEGTEPVTVAGTPLRVFAPRGKLGQTRFGVEFTAKLLPWYESYFAVPYPYVKYDQVAVPGFDAGAMENVGLVLFRQNLLLMDPATASWKQEKTIAKVIAHEFAHMWFGNLVTMRWWDDLWLNEAFAEWMAHKAVDAQTPSYRVWDDFQDDKNRALIDDALPATHPIWTPVETPEQAIEMFDVITYQKGCAVMRMLENFLGEEKFRAGLRTYMKTYAEGNATGADLWRELEKASQQPVKALMESWVTVSGFPLLDVGLGKDGALTLSQRRFFSSAKLVKTAESKEVWNIPVVVRYEDQSGVREHRFILRDRTATERLPVQGEVRWVYPNASEIGFYRARLDEELETRLLARGFEKLTAVEQMGFIEDQWALVRNASSTIERFLAVLEACGKKHDGKAAPIADHNVLRAVVDRFGTIDHLLKDAKTPPAREKYRAWTASTFRPVLAELGLEPRKGEAQNDVQRRSLVVHAMARLARDKETIAAAERLAERERKEPEAVDPNLAGTILGIAAMFGDEARYHAWVQTYRARREASAPPQATLRYLYTLAMFRPEDLTRRTLGLIDDGTIPQEAVGPVLGQLLSARETQLLAWEHLKSQWATLTKRVGDMGMSRLVEAVGGLPFDRRADIVGFFEKNPPAGAERALQRALETMDEREELRARITPGLLARFA